jgi:hypothetical protein
VHGVALGTAIVHIDPFDPYARTGAGFPPWSSLVTSP